MKTTLATILLPILSLTACRTCPQQPSPLTTATHTSVTTHTTIDTIQYILPPQSASQTTRDTTSTLTTDYAISHATLHPDGTISHILTTNPHPISLPSRTVIRDSIASHDRTITLTVPAQLTPWQRLRINAFPWLAAILIIIAATFCIRYHTRLH